MKVYSHWDIKKAHVVCICTLKKSSKRKKDRKLCQSHNPVTALHLDSKNIQKVRGKGQWEERENIVFHTASRWLFFLYFLSFFLLRISPVMMTLHPTDWTAFLFSLLVEVCKQVLEVPTDSPAVSSCRYLPFFSKYRLYDFFSS